MIDVAQRFATADPATTPPDAPLPEEALALLDRVMTPRAPHAPVGAGRPVPARPRPFRLSSLTILVPALVLVTVAAMGWGWFSFGGGQAVGNAEATPSPAPPLEWGEFTTEGALVAASEAIVTATTVDLGILDDGGLRYYIATVQVISAAKGAYDPGTQLEVAFPDPGPDEESWPPGLNRGETALLFLTYDATAANASLISPTQGSYRLTDSSSGPEPHPGNPLILDDTFLDRMNLRTG